MTDADRQNLRGGFWATSLGTLSSRVLGLLRDMATAALFGLDAGGVMDAFVVAFRLPNLFRRVFGEGALATSYLPVLTDELQRDRRSAWRFASTLMTLLTVLLALVVVVGELVCAAYWQTAGEGTSNALLAGLSATMLPYLLLICLSAQLSATLQAVSRFSVPAAAPALLNVCWLAGAWFVAPRFAANPAGQAYVLAGSILISGALQVLVQLPPLWRAGFRFELDWRGSRAALGRVLRSIAPIAIGLAALQLNAFCDSFVAWGLTAPAEGSAAIGWLGGLCEYPVRVGATTAIYYGERFYQLPVALLGISIATVIYPLLARHAARGHRHLLAADLTFGIRFTWFLAIPAAAGLLLLAHPLTALIFERGAFNEADVRRTATLIACYATGTWAYCALPVLMRGYFALGDRVTPARVGLAAVGLNLVLNLALVWPLAEAGLAMATVVSAAMQVAVLCRRLDRLDCRLDWSEVRVTLAKSTVATLAMALVVGTLLNWIPADGAKLEQLMRVGIVVVAGGASFLCVAVLLRAEELSMLTRRVVRQSKRELD